MNYYALYITPAVIDYENESLNEITKKTGRYLWKIYETEAEAEAEIAKREADEKRREEKSRLKTIEPEKYEIERHNLQEALIQGIIEHIALWYPFIDCTGDYISNLIDNMTDRGEIEPGEAALYEAAAEAEARKRDLYTISE